MNIRTLIDGGLRYLTTRRDNMGKKRTSGLTSDALFCRQCGGEVVEVNANGRRACFVCGKRAPNK